MAQEALDKKSVEYIVQNMDTMPRSHIMKHLGISSNTLYRYIWKYGGSRSGWKNWRNPELDKKVIELYADHTNPEIAKMTGATIHQICRIRAKYKLRKSAELREELKKKSLDMCHSIEVQERAFTKIRKMRKADEMRMNSGEQPIYNWKHRKMHSKAAYMAAWYQCKENNYFRNDEEPYTLYYDSETTRSNKEKYFANKYGLKFEQADE